MPFSNGYVLIATDDLKDVHKVYHLEKKIFLRMNPISEKVVVTQTMTISDLYLLSLNTLSARAKLQTSVNAHTAGVSEKRTFLKVNHKDVKNPMIKTENER